MELRAFTDSLAERHGLPKSAMRRIVDDVMDELHKTALHGGSVHGFGRFVISKRSARQGRNPHTGETIQIPAKRAVRFVPGKALKDALNG